MVIRQGKLYIKPIHCSWNGLLSITLLILFVIMSGANTENPDYFNYSYSYGVATLATNESWLYYALVFMFKNAGMPYQTFRIFLYALGLIVIYIANKKLTQNYPFFYFLYFISLIMIDTTQTFNFLAMSFFTLGISYLLTSNKFKRLKYIICILIAMGFHFFSILYLPFVFFYKIIDKKVLFKLFAIIITVIVFLSTIINVTGLIPLIRNVLDYFDLSSYLDYLNSRTNWGHLLPIGLHLASCFLSYYFYIKVKNESNSNKELPRIIFLLNLYGIFFFPLFGIQLTLARITRNLLLVTFMSGIFCLKNVEKKNTKLKLCILLIGFAILQGYFTVYNSYMEDIVLPFFKSNWILNG